MSIINVIFSFIVLSLDVFLAFSVVLITYDIKMNKQFYIPIVLVATVLLIFNLSLLEYGLIEIIFQTVIITIICRLKIKKQIFDTFSIIIAYMLCLYLIKFTISSLVMNVVYQLYLSQKNFYFVNNFISMSILIIFYFIYQRFMRSRTRYIKHRRYLSILSFLGFFCMFILGEKENTNFKSIYWVVLTTFIFLIYVIMFNIIERHREDELNQAIKERNEQLEQKNNAFMEKAKFFHDMNNHIIIIARMLNRFEYDAAVDYINSIANIIDINTHRWTGHYLIDDLIATKKVIAERYNIHYKVNAEFPENHKVTNVDICIILSNIMDNAIEGCQKVSEPERWISVTLKYINNFVIIKVSNSSLDIDDYRYTSKNDEIIHGWGIQNVKGTINKYEGDMEIQIGSGVFSITIVLFDVILNKGAMSIK